MTLKLLMTIIQFVNANSELFEFHEHIKLIKGRIKQLEQENAYFKRELKDTQNIMDDFEKAQREGIILL